ncbi:MAG TPA: hypothetical protein VLK85_17640 [Ramlibacter sp.]|nr:hypothetical protein [Ramlibacter sp.]
MGEKGTDASLWITWYDLPPGGDPAYLAWLHGSYLPRLLAQPGVLHASHYAATRAAASNPRTTGDAGVPAGKDYVLIVGAESAHVFARSARQYARGDADQHCFESFLDATDREMLALRLGTRVCITAEVARVDGPEAGRREAGTLAPCIQLGSLNAASAEAEEEMLAWYAEWRMPAFAGMPGCIGLRKMVSVSGWAKHVVLYEFADLASRNQYPSRLKAMSPEFATWDARATASLVHAPGSPMVAERLWPAVG